MIHGVVFKSRSLTNPTGYQLQKVKLGDSISEHFIERFHSRGQHLCKFEGTKENVSTRKEFNSHRIGLEHQHGLRFIVVEHQNGHHDVM